MLRKIIPSTLIGRSIIIIFVPIIILVLLTSLVFYQTSWNIISKRLAESVVADINVLVKLIDDDLFFYASNNLLIRLCDILESYYIIIMVHYNGVTEDVKTKQKI